MGQTGGIDAANALIPAVSDRNGRVVREALEALGKVIGKNDLSVLKRVDSKDQLTFEGLAWSFYRAGSRGITDSIIIQRQTEFLQPRYNQSTRLAAAFFFSRSTLPPLTLEENLIRAALYDSSSEVRIAVITGLKKLKNEDKAIEVLKTVLERERDYRGRVNAVRCLGRFPWTKTIQTLSAALGDSSVQVRIAVSETVEFLLRPSDSALFINAARHATDFRVQANLYGALLATGKYPSGLIGEVKDKYNEAKSEYQKSFLLGALSHAPQAYPFIFDELIKADVFVIKSAAAAGLTVINHNKNFPIAWRPIFLRMYRELIGKQDPAVVGIISEALGDPDLGYKDLIRDFNFLYEAKKNLRLPRDIESLQPLENTIAYFEGKEKPTPLRNDFNHEVDWLAIREMPEDQQVLVETTQGSILLRLYVEDAPGSVANFIDLVGKRYFDGKYFHRVVPNFVVQTGCNRGDGFGSEEYSIRSEFSERRYKTGSVGMASAGKTLRERNGLSLIPQHPTWMDATQSLLRS